MLHISPTFHGEILTHIFERIVFIHQFSSYDGLKFEKTQNSYYSHSETFGLGNYRGNAFTTGCSPNTYISGDCDKKTEIFDMEEMQWYSDKSMVASETYVVPPDYPFTQTGIYHYSTTHTTDAVFIIGGPNTGNIAAEFRDHQWKHVADLKQARSGHSSIPFGSQTIIIGGQNSFASKNIHSYSNTFSEM